MAHVLFLSLVFPPDNVSTAVIMGELAADLKAAGHEITVVTTTPHYNRDREAERRQPLRPVWGPILKGSEFHGIRVLHVAMPQKSSRIILRLLAWAGFHLWSLVAAGVLVRRVDVILAPSPPLTIGLCAWLLGCAYRAPFVYNAQELYPDIAVALGAIRRRGVIQALLALERFVYARAAAVTVIAQRMRSRVIAKGFTPEKIRLIPNFVDVEDMLPQPKSNAFAREHGIERAFVVLYAGNIGPAQGLGVVLDAAELLLDAADVTFLFVGEGAAKDQLRESARERHLDRVVFLDYQDYGRVPEIYAASDLCLVPLATNTGSDAVPSKVYRIMACGRPVLACADAASDLAELVAVSGGGTVVPPASPQALAEAVREAKKNPQACAEKGAAGRRHVLAHYSRRAVSGQYEALVRELTGEVTREGADRG
jgi:colanic acid biosynthesis glycosyl transferase WcaI